MLKRVYPLRKSRKLFHHFYSLYRDAWKNLDKKDLLRVEDHLEQLDHAIESKDRESANQLARDLESWGPKVLKKTIWGHLKELVYALIVAFLIAVVIRQMVFENYTIPTGSMRPNFREQDGLIVSKTTFGINIPLTPKHFLFRPDLLQRGGVITFTTEGMDVSDQDMYYLNFIPYKKRLIKRLIALPGDTVYFYGGHVYGIDKNGESISDFVSNPWLQKQEYIPFNQFEGTQKLEGSPQSRRLNLHLSHFNEVRARIFPSLGQQWVGEVYNGKKFVPENLNSKVTAPYSIQRYSDYMGIHHFAMGRLLTRNELENYSEVSSSELQKLGHAPLYLELKHHPQLTFSTQSANQQNPNLASSIAVLPLNEEQIQSIAELLYTSRFDIEDGLASRLSISSSYPKEYFPSFSSVPNGRYEFFDGKAYSVSKMNILGMDWGGYVSELEPDHPLYSQDPLHVQKLYNMGMEMLTPYMPNDQFSSAIPARYVYFRSGDLYLMGKRFLDKDSATLKDFVAREEEKERNSSSKAPYTAFVDRGPPLLNNGGLDIDLIRTYGIKVPDGHYLCLGDNHAGSQDCRTFGFVPEQNLRGTPLYILWPPGARWGSPAQIAYRSFQSPTLIVWGILFIIMGSFMYVYRKKNAVKHFVRLSK